MEKGYKIGGTHMLCLECFDCYSKKEKAKDSIDPATEQAYLKIAESLVASFVPICGTPFSLEIRESPWDAKRPRVLASIATIGSDEQDIVDAGKEEMAVVCMCQEYFAYHRPSPENSHKGRSEIDMYMFKRDGAAPAELRLLAEHLWQSIYRVGEGLLSDWQVQYLGSPEEFDPFETEHDAVKSARASA